MQPSAMRTAKVAKAAPGPRWTTSYTNTARRDEMYEPINPNDQIRTGNYYHDGFYLRFGVGGGWMYGEASGDSLGGDVKTTGLTTGTWQLDFTTSADGVAHSVRFDIR